MPTRRKKINISIFDCLDSLRPDTTPVSLSNPDKVKNPEEIDLKDDPEELTEVSGSDLKVFEEPEDTAELLRKVFLDSEDEDEPKIEENPAEPTSDLIAYEDKLLNTKRNTSPAKGIFENIDFDSLNSIKVETSEPERLKHEEPVDVPKETYGPKLPERFIENVVRPTTPTVTVTDSSSSDSWVEKDSSYASNSNKKKKKKKVKHKSKHKHKHKHKHKKHHR